MIWIYPLTKLSDLHISGLNMYSHRNLWYVYVWFAYICLQYLWICICLICICLICICLICICLICKCLICICLICKCLFGICLNIDALNFCSCRAGINWRKCNPKPCMSGTIQYNTMQYNCEWKKTHGRGNKQVCLIVAAVVVSDELLTSLLKSQSNPSCTWWPCSNIISGADSSAGYLWIVTNVYVSTERSLRTAAALFFHDKIISNSLHCV